jgi:hypothetical protein
VNAASAVAPVAVAVAVTASGAGAGTGASAEGAGAGAAAAASVTPTPNGAAASGAGAAAEAVTPGSFADWYKDALRIALVRTHTSHFHSNSNSLPRVIQPIHTLLLPFRPAPALPCAAGR